MTFCTYKYSLYIYLGILVKTFVVFLNLCIKDNIIYNYLPIKSFIKVFFSYYYNIRDSKILNINFLRFILVL